MGRPPTGEPERPNRAPGVALRTAGSGASGLRSEALRQVPGARCGGCWPPPPPPPPGFRNRSAGPSSLGGGACPRFRVRHQEVPVGKLPIGQPGRGMLGYRALVSMATSGPAHWLLPVPLRREPWRLPGFTGGAPRPAVTSRPAPRGVEEERPRDPSACPVRKSEGANCSCEHTFIYNVIGRQTTQLRLFSGAELADPSLLQNSRGRGEPGSLGFSPKAQNRNAKPLSGFFTKSPFCEGLRPLPLRHSYFFALLLPNTHPRWLIIIKTIILS